MAEDKLADQVEFEEEQAAAADENTKVEYIEYLGEEPYGTAFLHTHTLPRGDGLWKRAKITANKDVTWERDPYGPGIGQKGNRMLVRVEDLPTGAAEALEALPQYKRVSE
jgi:hypothetical protein